MKASLPLPAAAAALLLLLAACTTGPATTTASAATSVPSTGLEPGAPAKAPDGRPFVVEDLGSFDEPWAMTFLPGTGGLLITERGGSLRLRNPDGSVLTVSGVPQVKVGGQGGLGDVVVSPDFATTRRIFLSWAEAGDNGTSGAAVGSATLAVESGTASLADLRVIWRQAPLVTGSGHFGHRLAFSPDGTHLFVTSGDQQKFDPAQDLDSTLGKVLRLNPDGAPASGNPFADRGGLSAQIWSYGHRNPLGIAFDGAGNLWSTEMGPQGGDELNLVLPGRNYGWPQASNGSHYGGAPIPDHTAGDGFEAPKAWWTPSVSPGSLMIYSSKTFPQFNGDAFVGALSGQALIRLNLKGTTAKKADSWDLGGRIREVEQAPDGSIWVLQDGAGARLLRLVPPTR